MKLKQQTCWTILNKFNYDNKLQIEQSTLEDGTVSDIDLSMSKNVELSQ